MNTLAHQTFPNQNHTLLAIDTSTSWLSLALQHQQKQFIFHQEVGNHQSEYILPEINRLFSQANINAATLDAIIYAQGPGAFTGLRIGIGVAQGLAAPFHTPLIGIPCLDAVAYQTDHSCTLAATDARMGEVFYAWFNTQQNQRLSDYSVGAFHTITAPNTTTEPFGIGNAFTLANAPKMKHATTMPTARNYLTLALSGRYATQAPAEAELLYVRNKIALTAQEQAARKAAKS